MMVRNVDAAEDFEKCTKHQKGLLAIARDWPFSVPGSEAWTVLTQTIIFGQMNPEKVHELPPEVIKKIMEYAALGHVTACAARCKLITDGGGG